MSVPFLVADLMGVAVFSFLSFDQKKLEEHEDSVLHWLKRRVRTGMRAAAAIHESFWPVSL